MISTWKKQCKYYQRHNWKFIQISAACKVLLTEWVWQVSWPTHPRNPKVWLGVEIIRLAAKESRFLLVSGVDSSDLILVLPSPIEQLQYTSSSDTFGLLLPQRRKKKGKSCVSQDSGLGHLIGAFKEKGIIVKSNSNFLF